MVEFNEVQAQLMGIDKQFRTLSIGEVKQLASVMYPKEQLMACLKGWYRGSVAVLCATDKRVIILDTGRTTGGTHFLEYAQITTLQHTSKGWVSRFVMVLRTERHEFRVWGMRRVKDLHSFMQRHMEYLKTTQQRSVFTLAQKGMQSPYMARSWRNFVRKIGSATL